MYGAAQNGHVDVVRLLLKAGAARPARRGGGEGGGGEGGGGEGEGEGRGEGGERGGGKSETAPGGKGFTPLYIAAQNGTLGTAGALRGVCGVPGMEYVVLSCTV